MNNPFLNTKSMFIAFLFMVLAYLDASIAAFLIGWATGDRNPLLITFTADIAATLTIYAWSRLFSNSSFYDPYWSLAPIAIAVFWVATAANTPSSCRPWIVIALVSLWGIRLTLNWARGWRGLKHEDWRYADMRAKYGPKKRFWIVELAGIELVPTVIVFLGCLSLYPVLANTTRTKIWWLDGIAVLVTAAAIFIESISDEQMTAFVKTKKPGEIMNRGFWKYSRHPNYFGEISFWWGLYLFGLAANPGYWWTIAGPIAITLLFLFISIPMMDKRSLERRPEYAEHMKQVSALVPWSSRK